MTVDEILAQAAAEYAEAVNKSLPDPDECTHQFSVGFERKIKNLTRRVNHPMMYRTLRGAASIFLAIMIGFSSLVAVNAEARAVVFGWIRQQYELFYEYLFDGPMDNTESAQFIPGWIPDSYSLESIMEIPGGKYLTYSNATGKLIQFAYTSEKTTSLFVKGVEYSQQDTVVDKKEAKLYINLDSSESNGIVWESQDGHTLFFISAYLNENELVKMAENISQK